MNRTGLENHSYDPDWESKRPTNTYFRERPRIGQKFWMKRIIPAMGEKRLMMVQKVGKELVEMVNVETGEIERITYFIIPDLKEFKL